jgi:hypothetical protein
MRKREPEGPATYAASHGLGNGDPLVVAIDAALQMVSDRRWIETEWFRAILGALFALPESVRLSTESHALFDDVADDLPTRMKCADAVNLLLDLRLDATRTRRLSTV